MEDVLISDSCIYINGFEWSHPQTRENCHCDKCWDCTLMQRNSNNIDINVKAIDFTINESSRILFFSWSDNHKGFIPFKVLLNRSLWSAMNQKLTVLWKDLLPTKNDFPCCRFDYKILLEDKSMLLFCFQEIMQKGIAQIYNAPTSEGHLLEFSKQIGLGPPVSTLFGSFFTVQSMPGLNQEKNQAYTPSQLPLHTDLPFYDSPPEIFLFSCLEAAYVGGESVYTDGFSAGYRLQEEFPHFFTSLCTFPITHRDDTTKWKMMYQAPIIEFDQTTNSIICIRDNPAPRDTASGFIPIEWYTAYKKFREFVDDEAQHFVYKMQPGDVTIFDNWRLYHGRFSYSGDRVRTMNGMYTQRTHLKSAIRMLEADLDT